MWFSWDASSRNNSRKIRWEFNMAVITTVPNVSYHAYTKKQSDEKIIVNTLSDLPEPSFLDRVEEPYIKASIITKSRFCRPCDELMY